MSDQPPKRIGFLADTNVVDAAVDGRVDFSELRRDLGPSFCTKHLERELSATTNPARREELLVFFHGLQLEQVDSATAKAAVSLPQVADEIWREVEATLASVLDKSDRPRRSRTIRNSHTDALHAEAAKRCGLTLVTGDGPLAEAAEERGISVKRTR
jgi:predicted nucleic acid-binding protein